MITYKLNEEQTRALILELKKEIKLLTNEERIKLRDHLFEGYCKTCGAKYLKGNDDCYCWRDK